MGTSGSREGGPKEMSDSTLRKTYGAPSVEATTHDANPYDDSRQGGSRAA